MQDEYRRLQLHNVIYQDAVRFQTWKNVGSQDPEEYVA
jgi:hypothetical protein